MLHEEKGNHKNQPKEDSLFIKLSSFEYHPKITV